METPADRPLIRKMLEDFRNSQFHFKELMVSLVRLREFPNSRKGLSMSQVITNRVRTFPPVSIEGTDGCRGARSWSGCRRWSRCSIRTAPPTRRRRRRRPRSPSRAASCSGSTATASRSATGFPSEEGADYDMTPCLTPLARLPQRRPRAERPGQRGRRRQGQRPHQLDERADDRHAISPGAARADRRSTR